MYISGGRTGDKNPALLEDGEYVLNREAVKGLGGPKAIDEINYKTFPRFANGGRLKSGERRLSPEVSLASLVSSEGADASSSINLSATSDRLSGFALENEVFVKEYFDQQRAIEEERRRRKAEKKAKKRQLLASVISSAATFAISSGIKGLGGKKPKIDKATGYTRKNIAVAKDLGYTDESLKQFQNAGVTLSESGIPNMQRGGLMKFNSGGYIPYGSRISDSVPAMLTGGEYVINSRAVRKYGLGGLNRINNGIARFQDGGMVGAENGPSMTQNETSSTSNISVNITVNNQAGKGFNESVETKVNGGTKTEAEKSLELTKKIKQVVTQVIQKEQRSGGLLDSTKKKQQ